MTENFMSATMSINVNGSPRMVNPGITLSELLASLDLDPRMIVVEHNYVILHDRDSFGSIILNEGDSLELVHFVGGG